MGAKAAFVRAACFTAFMIVFFAMQSPSQQDRGKAELKSPGGAIVVDYGRPELKGRDPLTWQQNGHFWRMGMNDMTTLTTPVALTFGSTKVPKGKYGLWLLKVSDEHYELVFNSEASGMGMLHDQSKDLGRAALNKETAPAPTELFTIDMAAAPQGGTLSMTWGNTKLSTGFRFAQ